MSRLIRSFKQFSSGICFNPPTTTMATRILKVDAKDIKFDANGKLSVAPGPTLTNLNEAVKILKETSSPVAFPTETVYGLGASALNTESVLEIYKAKNRPADNPLILHISTIDQLHRKLLLDQTLPDIYKPLIDKFWPGPLTILLPVPDKTQISSACTVGQRTFAVRMPQHPVARALIALLDVPLAAPSANTSTKPSPTRATHVLNDLQGRIPLILDGGPCDVGVESTVIDGLSDPPTLLRPGGVSIEDIRKYGGDAWQNVVMAKSTADSHEQVQTPGMKYKHYSPTKPVILCTGFNDTQQQQRRLVNQLQTCLQEEHRSRIGLLRTVHLTDKLKHQLDNSLTVVVDWSLGITGSDISRNLFTMLRDLDLNDSVDVIVVEGIGEEHQGLAIMNRLRKAASTIISN